MKYALFSTLALLTLIPYTSFSQEYSYTHYDITEGLAGSTVYCITQDKDGFIWSGTETGVSRFDGTHFKNFTTADGLPDIEVLQLFGDSKGRVWMAPFRKSVCYYYKGRIYNQDNDSLLHRIHLRGNIENFAEDAQGNILIQERVALHLVLPNGDIRQYDSIENSPIRECVAISQSLSGHFQVQEGAKIWTFSGERFSLLTSINLPGFDLSPLFLTMNAQWIVWRDRMDRSAVESLINGQISYRPFNHFALKHISYSLIGDSLLFFDEFTGATEYNIRTGRTKLFLPGIQVSRSFRDMAGNLWFTTLGQGIFRLNSDEFNTIKLKSENELSTSVYAIARIGHNIWVGNDHQRLFKLSLPDHIIIATPTFTFDSKGRVLYIDTLVNNEFLFVGDNGVEKFTSGMRHLQAIHAYGTGIKSVIKKSKDELLLGTTKGVYSFSESRFSITDTLWRERSTTVFCHDDTTYIGTMNGLYRINPDKSVFFFGRKIPFLRKRISSVAESGDHILWVASYDDAGIIGIRNDTVVAAITRKQGLTSDIIRTLLVDKNILWVGTDKGLNKVRLDKPGYPVTRYTSNDGLGSDMINTLYADSSMIYVGTPAGLSYFDETRVNTSEECRLYLLSVINAGIDRIKDTSGLSLSYKQNDIHFEFAGISYRSVGDITYKYRLNGLDSTWRETKNTSLEYLALPPDKYRFQLQAINKFELSSRILSLDFVVTAPFWKTIWFYGIVLLVFLCLVWLMVSLRIRTIRHRQEEKDQLNQKMFQLEQRALQAQMNPHFIFNCLNSIQQDIFGQDIFTANKYISGLAKLIRATLQNSTLPFITLAEEIEFLSTYLSLEKLRFKDKMEHSIAVGPGINKHSLLIPPMILQPYVENSMRHGLRHKTEGKGYIRIEIKQENSRLTITIEDNGIGREKAARYKTAEHIEYQSKGMLLTADRIRIMNTAYDKDINVEVTDLKDDKGLAGGTRVVIQFLLFDANIEK